MSERAATDDPLTPTSTLRPTFRGDERGAALVEFLVALMPLMITFSATAQMTQIAIASLIVKHSAVVGARSAAVNWNEHQNTPEVPTDTKELIEKAVTSSMGLWHKTMSNVEVDVEDRSSCDDPHGMVSVRVTATHRCTVPFGRQLVCGGDDYSMSHKMSFPHQGARYADSGGTQCD